MAFVHLHTHSQFTLLDGAMSPTDLVKGVKGMGHTAVALTDRCNLYGAVGFYKDAKAEGIHGILGAEIAVQPEGMAFKDPRGMEGGYNLLFLVMDDAGYQNLCALITRAIFEGLYFRPRIDLDLLRRHHEGLIVLAGGLKGPMGRAIYRRQPHEGRQAVQDLLDILGPDRLYLELVDTALPGQPEANAMARELAASLGLHTVVTNAVHYLQPQDAITQDVLHCVAQARAMDDESRRLIPTDQCYLKSEEELRALFPDDGDAIDRTVDIAEKCHYKYVFGTYHFPATTPPDPEPEADTERNWVYFHRAFPPPQDFGVTEKDRVIGAGSLTGYFGWYAREGLRHRLKLIPEDQHPAYWDRLEMELRVIAGMGFPAYLLIVAEFINWSKDHGIPVGPGRGSAAGSLVAFSMRITDVDPLRFDLLFERFLNPERISMPDIDVDFCQDRREEAIVHVSEKYGAELVSQIITFGKFQAKLAVRDVARVVGLLFSDADRIAKLIPNELNITLKDALKEDSLKRLAEGDPKVGRIIRLAQRVEGMCRQTGVHAAGVVISDQPLVVYSPLYRDSPEGGPVVQYDMKSVETVGLIKFDFLGLKTLDQIRDALAMIARNTGERIELATLPLDDAPTYKILQAGDALGIFQVESSGMRDLLIRLRPENIDEVIALIALYRPGPLGSGMVDDFIDRKHGRKPVTYLLPGLEGVLRSTYGVVVYQEQVMQVAQILSGYSLGEADLLRRAMGKKKPEEMAKQKVRFLAGARENKLDEAAADEIFELLQKFAAYGFNKSHSAAYGIIAYQTAWLKAHYRAEYMAALMSIDAANTDKVLTYINDCRRAGLEILPPDVQHSLAGFDVPKASRRSIRFGLTAIKGLGDAAVDSIIEARRKAGGAFKDFLHFLECMDAARINKRVMESLIRCGAFDWTGTPRRTLNECLEPALKAAQKAQEEKASGQVSLFGASLATAPTFRFPDLTEWPTGKRLSYEKEALGFFITGHPLDAYGTDLDRVVSLTLDRVQSVDSEKEVTIAGIVTALRTIKTKRGDRMAFATLEDRQGAIECVFFSDAYQLSREALGGDVPLVVSGKIEKRGSDEPKMLADKAEPVADVLNRRTREVTIEFDADGLSDTRLEAFIQLLIRYRGACQGRINLRCLGGAQVPLKLPPHQGISADDALRGEVESLLGVRATVRFA